MSKKYILIQNDGAIESNSFELIGASTKRGEAGKIGFFGSGLKYSIAYMMRKGIDFKVFSGLNELVFTTKVETLKSIPFERICINGMPTSYTTTMGPTWTEDWLVLREIYCNAVDEGTCQLVRGIENPDPSEGKTRIFIELTPDLQKVIEGWDSYFCDERTPLFVSEPIYTCYLGNQDGGTEQPVSVFEKTEGVIYRRGIRVHTRKGQLYDYNLQFVNINEDRTCQSTHGLGYISNNLIAGLYNQNYVKSILRTGEDTTPCREYAELTSGEVRDGFSLDWIQFSKDHLLVVKDISGRYSEEIMKAKKETFLIPSLYAREMKKSQPDTIILGMQNLIGENSVNEISRTPKMDFLLKEVLSSLEEMKYQVPYDIKVVQFDDENVMGVADIKSKLIMIADKTFDMGRREIAMTLLEETEHIKSGHTDETRAFQTHIFSQWLKTMEDSNGLFL